jgi:hypothetical protein
MGFLQITQIIGLTYKSGPYDGQSFCYGVFNEKGSSTAPLFQMLTPKHTMSDLYLT